MDIGLHCSFGKCQKLDFLPIKCHFCGKSFCEDHYLPESHDCSSIPESLSADAPTSEKLQIEYETCSLSNCSLPERKGAKIKCDKCNLLFCLGHRHPDQHLCPVEKSQKLAEKLKHKQELEAGQREKDEKLKKLEDLGITTTSSNGSSKSSCSGMKTTYSSAPKSKAARERAAKVAVMKLRGKAKGPNSIPQADRVYFNVDFESKKFDFFTDKNYSVGRMRESFISTFKLKNATIVETSSSFPLDCTSPISELLENGILLNGDVINIK